STSVTSTGALRSFSPACSPPKPPPTTTTRCTLSSLIEHLNVAARPAGGERMPGSWCRRQTLRGLILRAAVSASLLAFNEYVNEEGTEVAVVQVHPTPSRWRFTWRWLPSGQQTHTPTPSRRR